MAAALDLIDARSVDSLAEIPDLTDHYAQALAAVRAHLTAPAGLLPDLPPRWSGHSLRRGFATAAMQAGKDLIARTTSSGTFRVPG
ncbi:hypothetical protein [Streptomyces sp. NBC_00019]|uniref:hypothetical protein n=1 Tax=Streptomyces sp. NBC_00019 TaxID=2975623 RepID=UPI002F910A28